MTRIEWDKAGERLFEAGVDQCVLYPNGVPGVPWNGVTAIDETSSGGVLDPLYYDGVKYADILGNEDFSAQLTAFSAPREFDACDGRKQLAPGLFVTQQPRTTFGLCYRTFVGNDLMSTDYGYKLHLVYNCTAAPTNVQNSTVSATINPDSMSWTIATVPPPANTFRPSAHIVIDSTRTPEGFMVLIEEALYGRDAGDGLPAQEPYLLSVDELLDIMGSTIDEFIGEPI